MSIQTVPKSGFVDFWSKTAFGNCKLEKFPRVHILRVLFRWIVEFSYRLSLKGKHCCFIYTFDFLF